MKIQKRTKKESAEWNKHLTELLDNELATIKDNKIIWNKETYEGWE